MFPILDDMIEIIDTIPPFRDALEEDNTHGQETDRQNTDDKDYTSSADAQEGCDLHYTYM